MNDVEWLQIAAQLGTGGVLAAIIFAIYRKDALRWEEAWKGQSQMLLQVVKENTAAITALIERLERR